VSGGVLTRREHQVVLLVAEGLTNAEIARTLWISPGTVRRHLENVFAKLGVHTRTAAVARIRDAEPRPDGWEESARGRPDGRLAWVG
jgi:DNA-binding CsgD family transcriptional regulator